ncbi:hypothetical protein DFH11DRAFT_1686547 [Phellopilus nigrolimitatus]|nr:hypothetical protein DFH11DRAFT_1686547 [Phellopilus nigrolimitatus]
MPARYAPLPNPRSRPDEDEMEAAFEASDDEDGGDPRSAESQPLNPGGASRRHDEDEEDDDDDHQATYPLRDVVAPNTNTRSAGQRTYDFENVDYDFPPPGSPPPRDRALLNNDWGNSNGVLPSAPVARPALRIPVRGRQGLEWVRRVLPARMAERLVGHEERRRMVVGGGENDGVFANVSAKPTAPRQIREDDSIYVQPEDAQKDAPPSYLSAQADAVPPYWETTIHAPSSLSPGMMIPGELPIDGLATGTLFSFLWNMLVSISFQFVGFLLTYLLHTTHAAKLGARAGLGLTLVQYGFALRTGRDENGGGSGSNGEAWSGWRAEEASPSPTPSFSTAAEADSWFAMHRTNGTMMSDSNADPTATSSMFSSETTTEWLSFLLMTIGWFVLLNSLLGFWRIKRWERSILASHEEHPDRPPPIPLPTATASGHARQSSFAQHFERTLGLRLPSMRMFQVGLGLGSGSHDVGANERFLYEYDADFNRIPPAGAADLERGSLDEERDAVNDAEEEILLSIPADHPERERLIAEAIENERRLQQDLRAAGLL